MSSPSSPAPSSSARQFLPPFQNCLVCSKSVKVVETSKNGNNGKICEIFCRVACRYLDFKTGNFGSGSEETINNAHNVINGDNSSSILCENCFPLAESFSKIYIEFQYFEQLFHSRMKESIDRIRIQMEKGFNAHNHDHDDVDETKIEIEELNRIDFREKFVTRGKQKLVEGVPTLQLDTQGLGLDPVKSQPKIIINLQETQSSAIPEPQDFLRDPLELETEQEIVDLEDDESYEDVDPDADGKYCCKICGKKIAYLWNYRTHQRIHTGVKPYKCRFCERKFSLLGNREKHERSHTGVRPYECTICGQKYCHSNSLNIHGNLKHPGEKFRGERKKKLKSKTNPSFKCSICGKTFVTLEHKSIHERSHSADPVPVTLATEKPVTDTCKDLGENSNGKNKRCRICGKSFDRWSGLRTHLLTHSGAKPFKCKFCGRAFASKGNLNVHERTHDNDAPYECAICGKKFRQSGTLNTHGRSMHPGQHFRLETIETFKCSVCDKVFDKLAHKANHERVHLDVQELPYQCGICSRRYRLKGQLESHEIEFHGKRSNNNANAHETAATATGIQTPDPDEAVDFEPGEGDVDEERDIKIVKVENPPSIYEVITLE